MDVNSCHLVNLYQPNDYRLLKLLLIYGITIMITLPGFSQHPVRCRVEITGIDSISGPSDLYRLPDRIDSNNIKELIYDLYSRGYVETLYTVINNDSTCTLMVEPGRRYKWVSLMQGNLPDDIMHRVNLRPGLFQGRIFNFKALVSTYGSILRWSENNGYPFARVAMKRILVKNNGISAKLDYEPGPLIVFDTLMVSGTGKLNKKFLAAYLGILPGELYSRMKVQSVQQAIVQMKGFSLTSPPEEYFMDGKCYLRLILSEKPVNGFDGYLGLLPNENQPGKLLVTGQVKLALNNLFKSGKTFELNWQRPNLLSQELALDYYHPCIFNSPVNGSVRANLYKQDTSYLNTDLEAGFDIRAPGFGNIGIEAGRLTTRILGSNFAETDSLFRLADTNTSFYGVNYTFRKIDDLDFPTRGWVGEIHMDIGNKKILRIPDKPNVFVSPGHQVQVRGKVSVSRYSPFSSRSTLLTRISGGILSDNNLFYSDLFRIGGLSSLRGFNEKYFYSSSYIIGNFEYRLRIEEKSFLLVFADAGWIGNELSLERKYDWPVGMGGGFNLGTPIGNLAVIYALGMDNNQDFNLKYSKIHIGYVSRF